MRADDVAWGVFFGVVTLALLGLGVRDLRRSDRRGYERFVSAVGCAALGSSYLLASSARVLSEVLLGVAVVGVVAGVVLDARSRRRVAER
jgi:hypothetical protein